MVRVSLHKKAYTFFAVTFSSALFATLLSGVSIAAESDAISHRKVPVEVKTDSIQSSQTLPAQPDRITGEYIKGYFTDTGKILVSPTNWDRYDWLKAGLVIGTATGIYYADSDIRNFSQRNQSSVGNNAASVGNALGDPLYVLPPLGLFYLYGHVQDDPKARRTALLATESLVISGTFTYAIKLATQRPRPFTGERSTTWDGPGVNNSSPSFPSGHTTTAFSVASVLSEEYENNPYVAPIAYGLATLTGLARINDNKHWASDVFIGGAIGYFVGKAVVRSHAGHADSNIKILPASIQNGYGLMAVYRF